MNCPNCGAQNLPNAAFCSQCATNLMAPPGMAPGGMPGQGMPPGPMGMPGMYGAPPVAARTSGMAIAGFVLSFFCGVLGLIFSILGYNEVKRSNGMVGGGGLALAGIIISIISLVGGLLWFTVVGAAINSAQHGHF
jgi:zinc ribbon protein